jgi:histidinol-phosphatase (PHP family)
MNTTPITASGARLPPDYHTHTVLCKHADGTTREYRETARAIGLTEICFTDHCPEPSGYDPRHRMTLPELPAYYDLVLPLQDGGTPPVLVGLEADYFPGCEPFLTSFLPTQPLDLVMGSVHYIKDWGFDNPNYIKTWESVDLKGVWTEYFKLIRQLVDTNLFDVLSHLDLPKKFGHRLKDRDMKELIQPLLDHVANKGMAFEINTSGWRRDAAEAYPSPLILSLAAEREIPITFGSDAHAPDEVGHRFKDALALALDTGCKETLRYKARTATRVPLSTWNS